MLQSFVVSYRVEKLESIAQHYLSEVRTSKTVGERKARFIDRRWISGVSLTSLPRVNSLRTTPGGPYNPARLATGTE